MPKKLYSFCCRLCLHDGTEHRLFDIFTVKALDEKLLKVFNIQVTPQDSCTTNICLSCFQETLTLELQMQQFQKHKHSILSNQQQLKKSAPAAVDKQSEKNERSELATTPSHQNLLAKCKQSEPTRRDSVGVSDKEWLVSAPVKIPLIASTSIGNGKHQLNQSSNASTKQDAAKAKKHKNSSPKVKASNTTPQVTSKVPSSKKKSSDGSCKSVSKKAKSTAASLVVNQLQPAEKQNNAPKKPTGGNLEVQSASKNIPPDAANGLNTVQQAQPTKPAKVKPVKRALINNLPKKTVPLYAPQNSAERVNNVVTHTNADGISPNLANAGVSVPNDPAAAQEIERTIPVHVIDVHRPTTQALNLPSNSLLKDVLIKSSIISKDVNNLPTTLPATSISQPFVASEISPGVSNGRTIVSLQGGLCSIPLANISDQIIPHESRNQTVICSNTPAAGSTQQQAVVTQPEPTNNSSSVTTTSQLLPDNGSGSSSGVSNHGTPGAITKRRHSTFIRVSSNLFNEPPEKAQFAMLNNNQFMRNNESLGNMPSHTMLPRLPILPQGSRVHIVQNPQLSMPLNTFNFANQYHQGAVQQPRASTSQSNAPTQAIGKNSNFGINYGINFVPSTVNSTAQQQQQQQQLIYSTPSQQRPVVQNNNVSNNYSQSTNNSQLSNNTNVNGNTSFPVSAPNEPIRVCFRCNLCSSYYLLESSLTLHLRRIHNVENNERTCTKIFDAAISNTLIMRIRRKSIADPLLLSNNRT